VRLKVEISPTYSPFRIKRRAVGPLDEVEQKGPYVAAATAPGGSRIRVFRAPPS